MFRSLLTLFTCLILFISATRAQSPDAVIKQFYDEALTQSPVYDNLRTLCKDIGHRLSGSPAAAAAVEYTRQLMTFSGFDTVYLQPVMVPHWIRGDQEQARIIRSATLSNHEMRVTALGNSTGTGPRGVLGEVVEVQSLEEVVAMDPEQLRGKIVFFNRPMDATQIHTFQAYGGAVDQRGHGHRVAAEKGAVGVIVRSMASNPDEFLHTGSISYRPGEPTVPAVAISTADADLLSKELRRDSHLEFYFETHCALFGEVLSYNVIGELRGSLHPDQYIAVGGHLDSWDLGEGAHDDGAGCMQSIEAVRLFKALEIKPLHTLRAVMWMNEENGLRGGREYARVAKEKEEVHLAAIESDRGGFVPTGFSFQTEEEATWKKIREWEQLFRPYNLYDFREGHGGADISPLPEKDVLMIGLLVDPQRYFTVHHSDADVFEKVDKRELELGAAAMAGLIYLIDREGIQ